MSAGADISLAETGSWGSRLVSFLCSFFFFLLYSIQLVEGIETSYNYLLLLLIKSIFFSLEAEKLSSSLLEPGRSLMFLGTKLSILVL
jgi:hypothetical protein